jgi:hypothetical protein
MPHERSSGPAQLGQVRPKGQAQNGEIVALDAPRTAGSPAPRAGRIRRRPAGSSPSRPDRRRGRRRRSRARDLGRVDARPDDLAPRASAAPECSWWGLPRMDFRRARASSSDFGLGNQAAVEGQGLVGAQHPGVRIAARHGQTPWRRPVRRRAPWAGRRSSMATLTASSSTPASSSVSKVTPASSSMARRAALLEARINLSPLITRRLPSAGCGVAQQVDDGGGGLLDRAAGHVDGRPAAAFEQPGAP